MAAPLAAIGLCGAMSGPSFDLAIAPGGEAAAYRAADGRLAIIAARPSLFAAEQWLRADADGRPAAAAIRKDACDRFGCVGRLPGGRSVSLVFDRLAFAEDCVRADIIVTPLRAPPGCAAGLVIDRDELKQTGAQLLSPERAGAGRYAVRSRGEDRPWSRAPARQWGKASSSAPALQVADEAAAAESDAPPVLDDGDDASPLE